MGQVLKMAVSSRGFLPIANASFPKNSPCKENARAIRSPGRPQSIERTREETMAWSKAKQIKFLSDTPVIRVATVNG